VAVPRRIAPVAPATSIPFEAAQADRRHAYVLLTGRNPDLMSPKASLQSVLGFIADEVKEFQASLPLDCANQMSGAHP
jgi:hypothetical protein